jgi:hypothetical protein
MADTDPSPSSASVTDVAECHRTAIDAILRATLQGVFSVGETGLFLDRIRLRVTTSPSYLEDGLTAARRRFSSGSSRSNPALLAGPTVTTSRPGSGPDG